ncbi:MAG: PAS domain S-box protein [Ferruginibacter sp.]
MSTPDKQNSEKAQSLIPEEGINKLENNTSVINALSIADSEEKIMLIMNAALDAIICIDQKDIITFWNHSAEKIFGWTAEQVKGQTLAELIIPEKYRSMHRKGMENYFKTGNGPALNVLLHLSAIKSDQSEFPIELTVLAIKQKGEEFFCAFIRDITESKRIEIALKESEKKFRTLAESSPQKVWSCGNDGKIIYANSQMFTFTGLPAEEYSNWANFTHPDDFSNTETVWMEALNSLNSYEVEERLRRYDGEYRWHLTRGVPEIDEKGNLLMWIGTCTDIHDQKIMSEELENRVVKRTSELLKVNEELKSTNLQLEQFAFVASHDLQEPLRKIQTFSDYILNNFDKPGFDAKTYLEKIHSSGQRMSALIKDLLLFSKLSKIDDHYVKTDLKVVLKNVLNDFELMITEKKAVVHSEKLPVIIAIPMQMNQLFYNLISNSLKFSDRPPVITITSFISKHKENFSGMASDFVTITFKDNGIGFEQIYADKIFTIFQRLNTKEKYEGTGIGLAMCKKIVENHFGSLTVTSVLKEGSSFILKLPVAIDTER